MSLSPNSAVRTYVLFRSMKLVDPDRTYVTLTTLTIQYSLLSTEGLLLCTVVTILAHQISTIMLSVSESPTALRRSRLSFLPSDDTLPSSVPCFLQRRSQKEVTQLKVLCRQLRRDPARVVALAENNLLLHPSQQKPKHDRCSGSKRREFSTKVCITDVVMLAVKLELYFSSLQNSTLLTLQTADWLLESAKNFTTS